MDYLNAFLGSSFLAAIVVWGLALYFLPKFLKFMRLEGRVFENTLTLVNAVLISYFIIYFLIVPIASASLPIPSELILVIGFVLAIVKIVTCIKSRRSHEA